MRIWRVLGVSALFLVAMPVAHAAPGDAVVRDYRASYEVKKDGSTQVVETLRVRLGSAQPGITRDFDASDPNWTPRDLEVTADGEPARIQTRTDGGLMRVSVVGGDGRSAGVRVFRFSYRFDDVLESANDDPAKSVLHWYAVAPNWDMRMNRTRIEVTLPNAAEDVVCTVGGDPCEVTEGRRGFTVTTGRLAPKSPVEVRAEFLPAAVKPAASATPTPTPTPTSTPTPSSAVEATATAEPTPTAEATPSANAADPNEAVVTPEENEDGSSISGTAVVSTLALVLLVAAALVWLMGRKARSEDEQTETLSFLTDEVVEGEVMDEGEVEEPAEDPDDDGAADAVDADVVEETADNRS